MKLKGLRLANVAESQEAVTDELKKVQKKKNGILGSFSETVQLYDRAKACKYASRAYFEYKKYVSSSCVFDFLKKKKKNQS